MKKLLVFELHHLGDAVMSLPFVRAARDWEVHVVCRPSSVPVYGQVLPREQIHPWDPWWELEGPPRNRSRRKLPDLIKQWRAIEVDVAVCVWADPRVHWLMRRSRARETFGFPVNELNFYAHHLPWRKKKMRLGKVLGFFSPLSHPLQRRSYQQAHLEDWWQLAEALGLGWNAATPWFDVKAHPSAAVFQQENEPLWLLHPGGRLPTKRWPVENFERLLGTFFRDKPVVILQPPDSRVPFSANPWHHVVKADSWPELLAWVQAADRVLCNDSLLSHLAAAQGKPVWTIFGSGNPNWFAPFQNERRVIASDVCAVRPCIDRCVHASPICLEAVTVEMVAAQLAEEMVAE